MINEGLGGKPYIEPDTYEKQRKARLQEAIDDYLLTDDIMSSEQIYEEIMSCINDTLSYYEKQADKSRGLKNLMMGYRNCDL